MRRMQNSVLRLSILSCLAVGGLAVSSVASAACTDTNTCLGTNALMSNTSGYQNTGIGYFALYSNTTGYYNTASGSLALNNNTTGYNNTASGVGALYSNTTGYYNTASGYAALRYNTTGYNNTASGLGALSRNTTGAANTASGTNALYSNTTGGSNAASGYNSLYRNTTGAANTASGASALYSNSGGAWNTANGAGALYSNISGNNNTASGANSLRQNTTGTYNTASGVDALRLNVSGVNNTASGAFALSRNASGSYNTADGFYALYSNQYGYRNVAMGHQAGYAVTGSDNIVIGASNQGVAGESGVVRIGTSAYQKKAFVAGIRAVTTGVADAVPVLIDSKGQLGTVKSSRRFKEDIQPMGSVSERLFALRPVTFKYRQPFEDGSKPVQYGLVAEEVAEVFPQLVVHGKDGKPETVAYHVLATLLLNELQKEHRVSQSLQGQVQMQAEELAALRQEVAVLAAAVGRVEKDRMMASTR